MQRHPTHHQIISAYRTLYRLSLSAIHYSTPGRYAVRNILRSSFRRDSAHTRGSHDSASDFNPIRIANTIRFLRRARIYNGYEHKILKNILFVRYWRDTSHHSRLIDANNPLTADVRRNSWAQFTATVGMLNESQGLCLRT